MKFTKTQWGAMEIAQVPTGKLGMIKRDSDGDLWIWERANGKHVWTKPFQPQIGHTMPKIPTGSPVSGSWLKSPAIAEG